MSVNIKVAGAWQEADETYVKVAGVWKPANQVFIKKDGTWVSSFTADATPPATPILSINNIDNTRFAVSVRMPFLTHQTDIRRIRVMVTIGGTAYPASPVATAGYYSAPNIAGGAEPWSDWYYNNQMPDGKGGSYVDGRSTAVPVTKAFAPTYKTGNKLRASTVYRFVAWAEDMNGNWSPGVAIAHTTGKDAKTANENKYTRVLIPPLVMGTTDLVATSFTAGEGYIGTNKRASFYYGDLLNQIVGSGTEILTAKMLLYRAGTDHGQPSARTYGAWNHGSPGVYYGGAGQEVNWLLNTGSTANSLAKGQGVWKDIPPGWFNNFQTNLTSVHLMLNPGDTLNTQALLVSQAAQPRQGTLELVLKN